MSEKFTANNKFNLHSKESDYKNLITRLEEIRSTIALLEKIIFR